MTNLFAALSGGLTRFIYAWLMPSAIAVAAFVVLVVPSIPGAQSVTAFLDDEPLQASLVFVLAVMGLSVVFAYASLPIYRVLEGYAMPKWLATPLRRRSLRHWYRLESRYRNTPDDPKWPLVLEAFAQYPREVSQVQPTRLGNALVAMETYGNRTFGLNSQTLWYELQSVVNDNLRRDTEDARAAVDFFVSAIAHLLLLATVSFGVAIWSGRLLPALVAFGALGLTPLAYSQAVRNVGDWRASVRALVNLGRVPLASALGYRLPRTHAEEQEMWLRIVGMIQHGPSRHYQRFLDPRRSR